MKFYPSLLTIICVMALGSSCNNPTIKMQEDRVDASITPASATTGVETNGPFAHTVYFWLNQPKSPIANLAFQNSIKKFILNSPDISTYHLGRPAATDRPVVENTYTFALLLTFEDKAAHDRYQEDPAHALFIKESEALWSKVVVYDSENFINQL